MAAANDSDSLIGRRVGGVNMVSTDVLEGDPENIASTVVRFLSDEKFVSKLFNQGSNG